MKLLIRWALNALALFLVSYLLPGVTIREFGAAIVAAAVLGVVNVLIRPVLLILTLPVNLMTLGLFTFVINALMFALAAKLVRGFELAGAGAALGGSILYGLTAWLLNSLFLKQDQKE